jgi:hypothetical protein
MSPVAPIGTLALRPMSVVLNGDGTNSQKGSWMSANPPADGMFFVDQPQPAEPVAAQFSAPAPAPEAPPAAPPQEAAADVMGGGMRDVPLGTLIFRAGLLAEEQVEDALQEGMRTGKRLGEVLLERGWLHERDLGRLLAGQKGLPFIELGAVAPDPAAVRLLPEEKARFQTALPIGFEDGVPVVAVADPSNNLVIENLRRALNTEPRLVVAAYSELARKIEHAYAAARPPAPQLAPTPEPQIAAAPVAESRASVAAPAPTPAAEPVAEQPPAPAVTPMQAVLPPVETRLPEPVQPVAPPVAEQLAPSVPEVSPPFLQPSTEQVAPVVPEVSPPLVQPLAEQPLTQQPVVEPAAPEQVVAPQPEVPAPQAAAPPVVEPLTAPAQPEPEVTLAPISAPPVEETPTHVPEFSQVPVEEPVLAQPTAEPSTDGSAAESSTHVEPAATPTADGSPAESSTHFVVLRLSEGEHLEVGMFGSGAEAQDFAREVVRQIAATEGESAWPFFAGRFLRPETIVSVDVIAESQERWMGSQIRSRWAADTTAP